MNERIRELAEQSGFGFGSYEFENEYDMACGSVSDLKKFAELIVRECAALCDLYAMPDGTSETAIILASAIRRKFGVEE